MRMRSVLLALCTVAACQSTAPPSVESDALRVAFLMLDGVYNSELIAPFDVFHHTRFHAKPGMRVFTVGRTKRTVTTFEGLRITPDYDLAGAPVIDVLVVPSAEHNMDSDLEDRALIDWIAARGGRAKWLVSVCDGAFLLAEAGLLDGHACTTFPGDIPAFKKRYPKLDVRTGVSFVADGRVLTGAGGARSYDPAMFLVERIYGAKAAAGIGKGLVIDWSKEAVPHVVANGARAVAPVKCWLPGDRVDPGVTVEDAAGKRVTLGEIAAAKRCKAIALYIVAGAEGGDTRKRGGLWCEDSFSDLPLLRHLRLDYEPKGVRFIAVCCPPVYHDARFGYAKDVFLKKAEADSVYRANRARFVSRTLALRERDVLPFDELYFDPRFRLLANPQRGVAEVGGTPAWQGRFKWFDDTQTYGTPTLWILKPDLTVAGAPFYMNVYESEGRKLRYTARDVGARLDGVIGRR